MANSELILTRRYHAPCGELVLGAHGDRLCLCTWANGKRRDTVERRISKALGARFEEGNAAALEQAVAWLDRYFSGAAMEFHLPLLLIGTNFQRAVWSALSSVPYGLTVSYAWLARKTGRPNAVRAVANANASNALAIFVPCHRVVSANGTLAGYAGGLRTKRFLIELERMSGCETPSMERRVLR